MPFSDSPPPFVIPKCDAGYHYARTMVEGDVEWRVCPDFKEALTPVYTSADHHRPLSLPQCARRNPAGDRRHSWCYRCPSGFMWVKLHVHDAENTDHRLTAMHV
jgi:hypothetical protein